MITDARVLRPGFVPQDLHHRHGAIDALASSFTQYRGFDEPENTLLTGPSGSGKTTLAKFVLDQLQRERLDIRWGYCYCISDSSAAGALHALLRDANLGADLRPQGTPRSLYIDRLRDFDGKFVAVLDEVDVLADRSILQSLYQLRDVSMIMITVEEDAFMHDLDQRVKSRIQSARKLPLNRYTDAELQDIIWSRVDAGLESRRVQSDAVDRIVERADGDARLAIAYLRRASKHVMRQGYEDLTSGVVETVAADAEAAIDERLREQLNTHQRLLLRVVREAGEISASELHERYERQASTTKSQSQRRRYLASLERYDLIESEGSGRGKRFSVHG